MSFACSRDINVLCACKLEAGCIDINSLHLRLHAVQEDRLTAVDMLAAVWLGSIRNSNLVQTDGTG